jgi:hypothetical protein
MTTVTLKHSIKNGSAVFSVEPLDNDFKFSQTEVQKQLFNLYKERYLLNSWRIFDKSSVMNKQFGR